MDDIVRVLRSGGPISSADIFDAADLIEHLRSEINKANYRQWINKANYRQWGDAAEMGNAVDHWFRDKRHPGNFYRILAIGVGGVKFIDGPWLPFVCIFDDWEHAANTTASEWHRCGVEQNA